MIPLRDNIPTRTFPFVNFALIGVNAAAFIHELTLGRKLEPFILAYGMVPLRFAKPALLIKEGWVSLLPLLTSMFLHGGWMHILSNMWVLYIFGDNVEDRLGHARYLLFYLLCGLAAGLAQLWAAWGSPAPTLGASGAIAGVMGAYFILYPYAKVVTVVPIFVFIQTVELPASIFLGLWLWSQLYSGTLALGGTGRLGGIAWWAHIGGFLSGVILLGVFLKKTRARSRWDLP